MSLFSFLFGSGKQKTNSLVVLDKPSFKMAILSKKVQLVDVRTPNEFKDGYIKNAVNIDYFNKSKFTTAFARFNKEEPLYIYCRSGNRSRKAAKQLHNLGFEKIFDLKGGYMNWN